MRTKEEIVKRINEIKDADIFGSETNDLISYLDYETAKQFITNEEVTEKRFNESRKFGDEDVRKEMKDYIAFAWGKAFDERGLSAQRSLMHYSAWIWLLNDGNFDEFTDKVDNDYESYGKPVLKWICEKYNLPMRDKCGELKCWS